MIVKRVSTICIHTSTYLDKPSLYFNHQCTYSMNILITPPCVVVIMYVTCTVLKFDYENDLCDSIFIDRFPSTPVVFLTYKSHHSTTTKACSDSGFEILSVQRLKTVTWCGPWYGPVWVPKHKVFVCLWIEPRVTAQYLIERYRSIEHHFHAGDLVHVPLG